MELSFPAFKYLLLFVLIVGWIYYRLVRSMRRKGKLHGRHLWRDRFNGRRMERLEGAESWEERRNRKQGLMPEHKIADRFLRSTQGDDAGAKGTDPAREEVPRGKTTWSNGDREDVVPEGIRQAGPRQLELGVDGDAEKESEG
ncbi:MAG: hypothetical protein KAY24_06065 [Candidatus Eisenbacteria sp.]|nr:hypothetical protein [Candidatus Eisenbacteria bacterium]